MDWQPILQGAGLIILMLLVFVLFVGCFIAFMYYKSFNIPTLIFEERANNTFQAKMLRAKRFTNADGTNKWMVMVGKNPLQKLIEIKPECKKNEQGEPIGSTVFDMGNYDMLILAKDENGNYCHVNYAFNRKVFENIPSEVHYWGGLSRRESFLNHQVGMDWKAVGIYALFIIGMIANVLMFWFTLDKASSVVASGAGAVPTAVPTNPIPINVSNFGG